MKRDAHYLMSVLLALFFTATLVTAVDLARPPQNVLTQGLARLTASKAAGMSDLAVSLLQLGPVSKEDARDLYDALDLLIASLKQMQVDEQKTFQEIKMTYKTVKVTIIESVTKLNTSLHGSEVEFQDLTNQFEKLKETIGNTQMDISKLRTTIKEVRDERTEVNNTHHVQQLKYEELIRRIDKALELLNSVGQNQTEETGNKTSLLQIHDDLFEGMNNLNHFRLMPLLMSLKTVSSDPAPEKADKREILRKVINLLENMRRQLSSELDRLHTEYNTRLAVIKTKMTDLLAILKGLKTKLKNNEDESNKVEAQKNATQKAIEETKRLIKQWTFSLVQLNTDMKGAKLAFKKQMKDYSAEINLIEKAIELLEENGINRPPKSRNSTLHGHHGDKNATSHHDHNASHHGKHGKHDGKHGEHHGNHSHGSKTHHGKDGHEHAGKEHGHDEDGQPHYQKYHGKGGKLDQHEKEKHAKDKKHGDKKHDGGHKGGHNHEEFMKAYKEKHGHQGHKAGKKNHGHGDHTFYDHNGVRHRIPQVPPYLHLKHHKEHAHKHK